MPLLVWAKRRTGRELGSATVFADSMQTMLCTYQSVIVLVGLLLVAALGWSWADTGAPATRSHDSCTTSPCQSGEPADPYLIT